MNEVLLSIEIPKTFEVGIVIGVIICIIISIIVKAFADIYIQL